MKNQNSYEYHQPTLFSTFPDLDSICVDGACRGNPGPVEYRGVRTDTGQELFRHGPFRGGTNNAGEFLALVHGLAYLKQTGLALPVYSDSLVAIRWVKAGECRAKLDPGDHNAGLRDLIDRAERWLRDNEIENDICHWNTREWGNIPADFQRK